MNYLLHSIEKKITDTTFFKYKYTIFDLLFTSFRLRLEKYLPFKSDTLNEDSIHHWDKYLFTNTFKNMPGYSYNESISLVVTTYKTNTNYVYSNIITNFYLLVITSTQDT